MGVLRTPSTSSTFSKVTKLRTGTAVRTEHDIVLNSSRYRFIEWGSWEFALKRLSTAGETLAENQAIPRKAYFVSEKARDSDEPGWVKIERAGGFNGDGVLDLLLSYQSKAAVGLKLWLSDPKSGKPLAPILAVTAYSDYEF